MTITWHVLGYCIRYEFPWVSLRKAICHCLFSHVLMNANMHDTTISIKIGMKCMELICW